MRRSTPVPGRFARRWRPGASRALGRRARSRLPTRRRRSTSRPTSPTSPPPPARATTSPRSRATSARCARHRTSRTPRAGASCSDRRTCCSASDPRRERRLLISFATIRRAPSRATHGSARRRRSDCGAVPRRRDACSTRCSPKRAGRSSAARAARRWPRPVRPARPPRPPEPIAASWPCPALRAALLGTAADTAARAGRFEEALGLLERAATLGPEGAAQADGRRAEILGRWVAALGGADDAAGVAAVYAAYATDIDAAAAPEDALAIARALGRLGLHPSAVRLLELARERSASRPEVEVALAEETLAAGDMAAARTVARRLLAGRLPAELLPRARAVAARAALATGDVAAAAELASGTMDAGLEADVGRALVAGGNPAAACALVAPAVVDREAPARVLLVAGAAAAAEGVWDAASEAYDRALGAGDGTERLEAAAGLARLALARGDRTAARSAPARAGDLKDALVRRAASAADRSLAVP